ncbi:hypothetical protein CC80DRAFT_542130 [Byssothecium circinans]|uniref:Rhodopsin domain-containing protein n=1 Tax=Byssothecium circinans TaxID=147558 RepID=A0A6A5UDI8_9PLEO|nr:hypothetical protein CC80DRAFT_542130 [Byssothecium circinans]
MVESRQPGALAATCIFPILAGLFVTARTASRYLGRNFGWDDWLTYLALLLLLGQTITIYEYIILSRTGYHAKDIPKKSVDEQVLAVKWSFAVQMFYHPLMGAIRASIIAFLFRVKDPRRYIQVALHIAFFLNIGYTISTSIVNVFQCAPIKYAYLRPQMDQEVDADGKITKHGKCINTLAFIMASCGLSIFLDFIIIPIPTAMVWNLQMRRKTKIAVVAIMSMGWIATVASVARLAVYYRRYTTKDRTWDIGLVSSIAEPSIAIIAACAPALRRLASYFMPQYFTEEITSYTDQTLPQSRSQERNTCNTRYNMANINKEMEGNRMDNEREDQLYTMTGLRVLDSQELLSRDQHGTREGAAGTDVGGDAELQCTPRSRSVKTGISEPPGEVIEAVPEHVLNKR